MKIFVAIVVTCWLLPATKQFMCGFQTHSFPTLHACYYGARVERLKRLKMNAAKGAKSSWTCLEFEDEKS